MDPDQTAPIGAVLSGSTLFVYEGSYILVDDKNIHFVIMRLWVYVHLNLRAFSSFILQIL